MLFVEFAYHLCRILVMPYKKGKLQALDEGIYLLCVVRTGKPYWITHLHGRGVRDMQSWENVVAPTHLQMTKSA